MCVLSGDETERERANERRKNKCFENKHQQKWNFQIETIYAERSSNYKGMNSRLMFVQIEFHQFALHFICARVFSMDFWILENKLSQNKTIQVYQHTILDAAQCEYSTNTIYMYIIFYSVFAEHELTQCVRFWQLSEQRNCFAVSSQTDCALLRLVALKADSSGARHRVPPARVTTMDSVEEFDSSFWFIFIDSTFLH